MITRERSLVVWLRELPDEYNRGDNPTFQEMQEICSLALRGLEAAILVEALECLHHNLGTVYWDTSGAERVIREALEAYRLAKGEGK